MRYKGLNKAQQRSINSLEWQSTWRLINMNCNEHDYIEIACLYHYTLKVLTANRVEHDGIAINTVYNEQKKHCLYLKSHEHQQLIELNEIVEVSVLTPNPYFSHLRVKG